MRARKAAPLLALAAIFAGAFALAAPPPPDKKDDRKRDAKEEEKLRKETAHAELQHCKRLEPIVKWAIEKKLKKQAAGLVEEMERGTPDYKGLADLKSALEACEDADAAPADVKEFESRVKSADADYAKDLWKLALECAKYGLYTRAYDLIGAVLEANPENDKARRIRGYVKVDGKWVSRYEADLLKGTNQTGSNPSKTSFVLYKDKEGVVQGWVPKKDVAQWDKGLRPFGGSFIPEAEEIRKCQMNEYRAWSVESEHFEVRTNISRAAAYEFGQILEDYHRQFFRTFLGFFDMEKGVELLFDVKPLKKKHIVLFFPDRNHYLQHAKAEHGNDELMLRSAGVYVPGGAKCARTSHLYKTDSDHDMSVMYHEVTHQLFAETKDEGGERGGSQGNNWVPEGIASYVETWTRDARGHWVPGGNKKHEWLMGAKKFLAATDGWKLQSFLAIDHDEFHKEPGRALNYAMSQALCHFLMHYDDERYREDFVKFIAAYYAGKVRENSLFEFLQIEGPESGRAETLEKQFKEYMAKLGDE
jgi:hypothetical protein